MKRKDKENVNFISNKLMLVNMLVVLFFMLLIAVSSISFIMITTKENAEDGITAFVNQAKINIEKSIGNVTSMGTTIFLDNKFREYLNMYNTDVDRLENKQLIISDMEYMIAAYPDLSACYIRPSSNFGADITVSEADIYAGSWVGASMESNMPLILKELNDGNTSDYYKMVDMIIRDSLGERSEFMAFAKKIYWTHGDKISILGDGVIVVKRSMFADCFKELKYGDYLSLVLVTSQNELIATSFSEGVDLSQFSSDKKNFVSKEAEIMNVGWKVYGIADESQMLASATKLGLVVGSVIMLAMVMFMSLSIYLNRRVELTIRTVADAFSSVGDGRMDTRMLAGEKDDTYFLATSFNTMMDDMCNLNKQVRDKELEKNILEINSLHSQINSHFLFNTLGAIRGMVRCGGEDKALSAIDNLVKFLRYSLNKEDTVTVESEIEYLKAYIEILKARYEDDLQVCLDIDENMLLSRIPRVIIQPLLENAIEHGIMDNGKVSVQIRGRRVGDNLIFTITDNGKGIEREKLALLRASLKDAEKSSDNNDKRKRGIGMKNVVRRLALLYDGNSYLKIFSKPGRGTMIKIVISCGDIVLENAISGS